MPRLNQQGIAPIILVIILTVIIAGVAGVAYKSRKEIKLRSDNTTEVKDLKDSPEASPDNQSITADQSGKLADKPFESSADSTITSTMPVFSITPPAGWGKSPADGNYVVTFESPSEDRITEGTSYFYAKPNISVFINKVSYKDLDEAVTDLRLESSYIVNNKTKSEINGQEVYIYETTNDIRNLAKTLLEEQLDQELANAKKQGVEVSMEQTQKDMDKILDQTKVKTLSYIFYKDNYFINVSGKSLESFWSSRKSQIKQSLDTFTLK